MEDRRALDSKRGGLETDYLGEDIYVNWLQVALVAAGSVVASSGFWAYVMRKTDRKDAATRLMMGLAYIEIVTLGANYIQRGSITREEYEDLRHYFYDPYIELGGNGVAARIMKAVEELPVTSRRYAEMAEVRTREGEHINNARVVARSEEASAGR